TTEFMVLYQSRLLVRCDIFGIQRHYMRNIYFAFTALIVYASALGQNTKPTGIEKNPGDKIICISGSMSSDSKAFLRYIAALTGKTNPKICFVPTASADNPYGIVEW